MPLACYYPKLSARYWLFLLGLLGCTPALAQSNYERCRWVKVQEIPTGIDTLSVIGKSLRVLSPADTNLRVRYDLGTNQIEFSGAEAYDSVLICYQVLPFNLSQNHFRRDVSQYDSAYFYADYGEDEANPFAQPRESLFELEGINKSGSLSRGVSFGNNQNATVNSALNLQLDGQLSDEISILATISDQNVPFQPEGNTLQIQEFDRIFIKLSHRLGSLSVGDLVLQNPDNYFLRYYKNVQGALLETQYTALGQGKARTSVGASVSKGKFASIQIPPIEGLQGPYKLRGPNNERFIIVLANSEKVFLDGRPLVRGYNNDYVIDYNLAEITFNNNIIITQFSRVRVDFEFSERNYNRSILTASHYQSYQKLDFFFNFYQAADNPRSPLIDLSASDINELSQIGDDQPQGFVNGIDSIGDFTESLILYEQRDTTGAQTGVTYPDVLVFSTDPNRALFRVSFTEVGFGQGDYVRIDTTVNGQVFRWVEPEGNVPQGNYAPIRLVPTPTKQQMISMGLTYRLSERDRVYAQWAFSELDQNRYARLGDEDNQGTALKIGYINEGRPVSFIKNYEWFGSLDFEWDDRYFRPIDRFRDIEFERDWSVTGNQDSLSLTDRIANASLGIRRDAQNLLYYRISTRQRDARTYGWQQQVDFNKELGRFLLNFDMFLLNSQQDTLDSRWQRFYTNLGYRFAGLTLGYKYNLDHNQVRLIERDSVTGTAMNYEEHLVYLQSSDTSKVRFLADYSFRYDNLPVEGRLVRNLASQTASLNLNTRLGESQDLGLILSYRKLAYQQDSSRQALNEDNVQGRLDWNASFLNRHIRSELSFSTATGRELRREFVFLQVLNGEGTHTWRDLNNDGVQDLNEFLLAINPDERNYIKVFTPTDDFIRAFTNNFIYRLNWEAPRAWRSLKGF
ncbi:MAG: hypothetical protein HC880_11880 [Bacteroidia bacterium]|nr:hypothetical protein [Bacteroidia bacterium]